MSSPVRVLDEQAPCERCGKPTFMLIRLHGERGGPEMCPNCCGTIRLDQQNEAKRWDHMLRDAFSGSDTAGEREVNLELIQDALRLTHPDLHTPARQALATRVTAELTARRPFAKPKPEPEPAPPAGEAVSVSLTDLRPPHPTYPCESCSGLSRWNYCGACAARWDAKEQAERDRLNARRRQLRRRWRKERRCICGKVITPKRRDATMCSPACRQRAYRKRKAAA